MGIGNSFVSVLLASPLHRVLSGSTGVVRYAGRVTNRTITTLVQYAKHGDGLVILVANPAAKKWLAQLPHCTRDRCTRGG